MPLSAAQRGTIKIAAASLAAVALLGASEVPGETGTEVNVCHVQHSAGESVEQRIAGVKADTARAVELQQLTSEQAAFVAEQLVRRIQSGALPI